MDKQINLIKININNQQLLAKIIRAIKLSAQEYCTILVKFNYPSLCETILQELKTIDSSLSIRSIVLDKETKTLYQGIKQELGDEQPSALMVFGIESVNDIDQVLKSAKQDREKISHEFSFPLVLWLTDDLLSKLITLSPDFISQASVPIEIDIPTDEVTHLITNLINSHAEKIFQKILTWGAGILQEAMLSNQNNDRLTFSELKLAKQYLDNCEFSFDNELKANLEFLLGYSSNNLSDSDVRRLLCCHGKISINECCREQYEKSLESYRKTNNLQHQACVLYCLGLWWWRDAMSHPIKRDHSFNNAKDYWQECVKLFRENGDEALEEKFINAEAEGLKRVQDWQQLETVGQRAKQLYTKYNDDFRLAQINGLLAEVEFYQNQNWNEAKKLAKDAYYRVTETLHNPPDKTPPGWVKWTKHYHRGWYLLPLAKAEYQLQEIAQAIQHLEKAREETNPEYDPELYIKILEELQDIYYQEGKYEDAFSVKQEQREIEQQFGFRAFIGLSPLPRKRRITNPALLSFQPESVEANVIGGSDRPNKVNELIARIGATHHKLIVVYGVSGVGKSSLLRAKLIPALQGKNIGIQKVLPILISQYPNWSDELGNHLEKEIDDCEFEIGENQIKKIENILEKLQKNSDNNILTVLIFDSLEELCFSSQDPISRQKFANHSQQFANFLQKSLNIPFVKVILSVREDYLYYLLKLSRFVDDEFSFINNNILNKDNLYYIGYLELDDARADILESIQNTTYSLEDSLLDKLINDLASPEGKVIPIELQMVGTQLENNKITTLEEYQELIEENNENNPKEILINRYLQEVTQDCGRENQEIAEVVLYCLTDANNIRPKKTYDELQGKLELSELGATEEQIDVVFRILTMSGLIKGESFFSNFKDFTYQLKPGYLTQIIKTRFRQNYPQLAINLARRRSDVLQDLAIKEINELNLTAQKSFAEHEQLQALEAILESGKKLKNLKNLPLEVKQETEKTIKDIIYGLEEYNHFDEHQSDVYSVDFSRKGRFTPDGKFLASASWDKTIEIWDVENDRLVDTLQGHEDAVNSVKISPDGKLLASASADRTIKVWLISWDSTKKELTCKQWTKDTLNHDDWVWDVCFSPDGKILASAGGDRLIKLWQLNWSENYQDLTIKHYATLQGHTDKVYTIDFSSYDQTLASGGEDNSIKLWDINTRECKKTLPEHNRPVKSVRFSHSGQYLASASEDGTIQLWDIKENKFNKPLNHIEQVNSVSFREDDQVLASGGNDNTVKLWSLDGDLLKTFRGHRDWVRYVTFSPNGKILASAGDDNTIKLRKLDFILPQNLKGHNWKIHSICFSPDGKTLASGGWDATIRLWSRQADNTWKETHCIYDTYQKNQPNWVWEVSFSPDGQTLVSGGGDNRIKLWSLREELPQPKVFGDHQGAVHTVRFSPDGKFIASGSGDFTVKLWDAETGQFVVTCGQDRNDQHTDKVWGIEFSPDGQILASTGADKTIKLWDLKGNLIRIIESYHKENYPEGHKDWTNSLAFSPDRQTLASASNDSTIKLWDLSNGKCLNTLAEHNSKVYDVGFSSDGQFLISASADKTLKIWSVDGTLLRTLEGHSDWVNSAIFSPDGQLIASASNDRTIKLWDLSNIKLEVLSFEELLEKGRNWLQHYENSQNNQGSFRQKFHS